MTIYAEVLALARQKRAQTMKEAAWLKEKDVEAVIVQYCYDTSGCDEIYPDKTKGQR